MILGWVLAGFVCLRAAPYLVSARGDTGPLIFSAGTPIVAAVAIVLCVAVTALIGGVVGRYINAAVGLFAVGVGLFVLDGRLDTARSFAFSMAGADPRWAVAMLAVETLLWAAVIFGVTWIVFAMAGPLKDIEPEQFSPPPDPYWSTHALKCAAAGVVMIGAVWVLARSPMKGQMIGATFLGGTLTGLIGRLISPHVQPKMLFASPVFFGAVGYLIAMFKTSGPLDVLDVTDQMPSLLLPMPIDYAAGSLMGVAFGLGWARSFLHHEDEPAVVPSSA